jgi:CheY-like chemotaxis protein
MRASALRLSIPGHPADFNNIRMIQDIPPSAAACRVPHSGYVAVPPPFFYIDEQGPTVTDASVRGILLVEDEQELRSLFATLLQMEQFKVFEADDGARGLELLDQHRDEIDVVITDLNLPGMGGVELISRVRSLKPSVKIIGTSGIGGAEVEKMLHKAGADLFLAKPFAPQDAIRRVKEILAAS